MKNVQQILIFIAIIALMGAIFGACVRDEFDHEQEPDCDPEIYDDEYQGPTNMVLGFGRGAIAAAVIRSQKPDDFALAAGVGGPVSLAGLTAWAEAQLADFDNWPESPKRAERILFFNDLFKALGNPLYRNVESKYYPPGTYADDFPISGFMPITINGFIDRLNPDGALPVVTFEDVSGEVVSFAVALDSNGNGLRDSGEPLILQIHEDFEDENLNGIYDQGETFSDFGIDGVDNTNDFGEGNGKFDLSPIASEYFQLDLAAVTANLDYDEGRNYMGAIYSDIGQDNPWGFASTNDGLIEELALITDNSMDINCIENSVGIFDKFFWGAPYPSITPYIKERFAFVQTPGSDETELAPWDETTESLRARRILQALFFISARTPEWSIYKAEKDGTGVVYEEHSFVSTYGERVYYSVGLPSGYNEKRSKWITYPILYVIPDSGYELGDWREILTYQGWLEQQNYAQKTIIVIIDPDGESSGNGGYGYFTGPVDISEGEIDAGELFEEIVSHVESRYRVKDLR